MNDSFSFRLPCYGDTDGKLIPFVFPNNPDFRINRLFYICDVPSGKDRANHACMNADIVLIAISGSVNVSVETNNKIKEYQLDNNVKAVFIPQKSWIKANDFSNDAILMGLSYKEYDDCDYLDDYDEYKKRIRKDN